MFWKKKSEDDGQKKLFKMPTETRGAFRVYPTKEEPIVLKVGSKILNASDICSGGISFDNKGFQKGVAYPFEMTLPRDPETIVAKVEVLKIDEKDVCRCKITNMTPAQEDQIHRYVLIRQKEDLADKKHRSV